MARNLKVTYQRNDSMERVLVTGSAGQLGSEVMKCFDSSSFEVHGTFNETVPNLRGNFHKMDLLEGDEIKQTIGSIDPDVIIHCAAMTDVDKCQREPELAKAINQESTETISKISTKIGSRLFYVSTDCVFDGKDGDYREGDPTNPIQVYGETKLGGEEAVSKLAKDSFCIVRTSVVFGPKPGNFVSWVIDALQSGKEISVVGDQIVTPTYSVDLAEKIFRLVSGHENGIWNISCSDRMSRLEMACIISNTLRSEGHSINSAEMKDMEWSAKRPVDSSLNTEKISRICRTHTFEDCLRKMME